MRTRLFALAIAIFSPALAQADVVDPEPPTCPAGSRPSTAHSGPYCAPMAECTSDSACSGASCMEVRQCVETRSCGGLSFPDAEPCTLSHVVGPCGGDGSCATGTCTTRSVCTSGGGASDGGCGCSAAGAPRSLAIAPSMALVALLAIRRRSPSARGPRP